MNPFWTAQRPRYLLSGLVTCAACGGGYSAISATHLGCSTARNKGPTAFTNRRTIKRAFLENKLLDALRTELMNPEVYRTFVRSFTDEWNRAQASLTTNQESQRAERSRVKANIKRLIDAILSGAPAGAINERLAELEGRRALLETELAQAEAPAPRLMPNLADVCHDKVADLLTLLSQPASGGVHDAIRALIDEIRLTPDKRDPSAPLTIEVRGELAAMLAMASGSKPEAAAAMAWQMNLVAGAGFEPAAFRL